MSIFRTLADRVAHERSARIWTVIGGVAAVAGVAVALVQLSQGQNSISPPAPSTGTQATSPHPVPGGSSLLSDRPESAGGPSGMTVRRSTGPNGLTLASFWGADLDGTAPDWDSVQFNDDQSDLTYYPSSGSILISDNGASLARVDGPPNPSTCDGAGYGNDIPAKPRETAFVICLRTSEHRLAYARARIQPDSTLRLDITVWDPPQA
jgi:hypothetical protein